MGNLCLFCPRLKGLLGQKEGLLGQKERLLGQFSSTTALKMPCIKRLIDRSRKLRKETELTSFRIKETSPAKNLITCSIAGRNTVIKSLHIISRKSYTFPYAFNLFTDFSYFDSNFYSIFVFVLFCYPI